MVRIQIYELEFNVLMDKIEMNKERILVIDKLIESIRGAKYSEGVKCDHCSSSEVIKYGKYKNIQRYKCKCCGRTFSILSKTLLTMTHYPEKWVDFLSCFQKGLSIRKCAELLDISVPTAFNWRHKLLKSISSTEKNKFSGIVEIGELYFPESEKGNKNIATRPSRKHSEYWLNRSSKNDQIPVIVAKDRFNNIISEVCHSGSLNRFSIDEKLGNLLDRTNTICTSNLSAYVSFCNYKKIKHYRASDLFDKNIKKTFNLENVSRYIKELKMWMRKFKGVASNKYLGLYLSWFKLSNSTACDESADTGKSLLLAV